jgi:hypothetical protein
VAAGIGLQLRSWSTEVQHLASSTSGTLKRYQRLGRGVRRIIIQAVAVLIVPLTAIAAFIGFVAFGVSEIHWRATGSHSVHLVGLIVWLSVVAGTAALYRFGDLTTWSMHPYYRRRLSFAYALQRTAPDKAEKRNYQMPVRLSETSPPGFPKLLICAAANVDNRKVTPPGLTALSFVFDRDELGYYGEGARVKTVDYEAWTQQGVGDFSSTVTLPAAVAMSGAALSPEMGHMTRRWLRALMAIGNVRLGVWVPNPRRMGDTKRWWQIRAPKGPGPARPHHLFSELLGLDPFDRRYLYVTDGGHWENLGLVELLRRRCRVIWCFDAAGDHVGAYHTLGESLALARSELNIEVDIDPTSIRSDGCQLPANQCESDFAVGTIHYGDGKEGTLIYVRAAVTPDAPWDVLSYADANPSFPTDPTLHQLYTYDRFDAYHALGRSAARHAVDACLYLRAVHGNGHAPAHVAGVKTF